MSNLTDILEWSEHQAAPETIDGQPPLPIPPEYPVTLEELLSEA